MGEEVVGVDVDGAGHIDGVWDEFDICYFCEVVCECF